MARDIGYSVSAPCPVDIVPNWVRHAEKRYDAIGTHLPSVEDEGMCAIFDREASAMDYAHYLENGYGIIGNVERLEQ